MILYWLWKLGDLFLKLFIPVKVRDVAKINRNEPCPVCNTRRGRIRTVLLTRVIDSRQARGEVFCEHTCAECGARWFEQPVVKVSPDVVLPAVARTDIEKLEDEQYGTVQRISVREAVN